MAKTNLTAERLRELLNYNPDTGVFTNKVYRSPNAQIGSIAGYTIKGYMQIKVDTERFSAHRLAWLYVHGTWPRATIDHKNGTRNDNRIENLREATQAENCQNRPMKSDNTSGFTGVRPHQTRWRADIKIDGKYKFIGSFATPELAYDAYLLAKAKIHTFQPTPRIS